MLRSWTRAFVRSDSWARGRGAEDEWVWKNVKHDGIGRWLCAVREK